MKQAKGAGGLPGADDDFTVVPVESTSESTERFRIPQDFILLTFNFLYWFEDASRLTHKLQQLMELQQV